MKIHIENIGMIEKADVEFNGITVICGENDTGKSTIGKCLYSMVTFFNKKEIKISYNLERIIFNVLMLNINRYSFLFHKFDTKLELAIHNFKMDKETRNKMRILAKKIVNLILENKATFENISKTIEIELDLKDKEKEDKENFINDVLKNFTENLRTKEKVEKTFLENLFNNEFSNQINNLNKEDEIGKVSLFIKDKSINVEIKNNKVINLEQNTGIINEAYYLDSSYFPIIPIMDARNFVNHEAMSQNIFFNKNKISEALPIKERLEKIMHLINKTNLTDIIFPENPNNDIFIKHKKVSKPINIKELSTGMKSFAFLKMVLENGYVLDRDILILDEPEIHMHPKWQLLFAEILIELQKEFNLMILINTHSPDFLDAIDTYAEKNEIKNKCKYYLAKDKTFFDKTDKLDDIYKSLFESNEILDNIKYE